MRDCAWHKRKQLTVKRATDLEEQKSEKESKAAKKYLLCSTSAATETSAEQTLCFRLAAQFVHLLGLADREANAVSHGARIQRFLLFTALRDLICLPFAYKVQSERQTEPLKIVRR